jgi:hypothetical protein
VAASFAFAFHMWAPFFYYDDNNYLNSCQALFCKKPKIFLPDQKCLEIVGVIWYKDYGDSHNTGKAKAMASGEPTRPEPIDHTEIPDFLDDYKKTKSGRMGTMRRRVEKGLSFRRMPGASDEFHIG